MNRKALLVGINYPGTAHHLRGCVADVTLMQAILKERFGFDPVHVRVITDAAATTSRILVGLEWLITGAQPGDVLYFHYSGHGSQMICADFDKEVEPDGLDEVIVPTDMDWRSKVIRDNDFARIFARVPAGVNLQVVLDCCHSGDSRRSYVPYEELSPNRVRAVDMPADIAARGYGLALPRRPLGVPVDENPSILLSGCKSNQTSADAWIQPARKYHGALTWHMASILAQADFRIDIDALHEAVSATLRREGFSQEPQLQVPPGYARAGFLAPLVTV